MEGNKEISREIHSLGTQASITVQLVRGLAGTTHYQREVVRGLGLRRVGAIVSRPDTPMIRGMVRRVAHLVRIVEAAKEQSGA